VKKMGIQRHTAVEKRIVSSAVRLGAVREL
jgi:hypothetical protein